MRSTIVISILAGALAIAHADPASSLSGRWLVSIDVLGVPHYFTLNLSDKAGALTGDLAGTALTGTIRGTSVQLAAKDQSATATLANGALSGSITLAPDPKPHAFTATRVVTRGGPPQRHVFTPTNFYREFSARTAPVLEIAPGDTIVTSTVDAGGFDAKGVQRVAGGNPQTGPFYVQGAMPGDALAVHVVKVRPNRDYATSTNAIVERALDPDFAATMVHDVAQIKWHLDLGKRVATSEAPGEHLKHYAVPFRPMLGCIATAWPIDWAAPGTNDSGDNGGNMDFNELGEGTTVYLPVSAPGALLYLGDGHALQGDGETTGDALETSMDVEVGVDLIADAAPPSPRVETATHLAALGFGGSVDDALRAATANMGAWLRERYALTPAELAQVLGTAAEYKVTEVADRNAGVALKIAKDRLRAIPLAPKTK